MAGVRDGQLFKSGPWPQGANNLASEGRLPTDEFGRRVALREAVNVDITKEGDARRRRGRGAALFDCDMGHSLWSDPALDFGLYVDGGQLYAMFSTGERQALGVYAGSGMLSYALAGDRVYYCGHGASGVLDMQFNAAPWAPEFPSGQPTVAAVAGGGLPAGQYQVAVTFVDVLGRESGTTVAATVELVEGQGIDLTSIPQPASAGAYIVIYATEANGSVLFRFATLPAGTDMLAVRSAPLGRSLKTALLQPMPPGQIVRVFNGVQLVAVGKRLLWSPPMRYGTTDPARNMIPFPHEIDLVEPAGAGESGAGVFVAAGPRTYWLAGAKPRDWQQSIAYASGAVPRSSVRVPGTVAGLDDASPITVWLARDGQFCRGVPGGKVLPMTPGRTAADDAEYGAALYRAQDGIQQVVVSLRGARKQSLGVTDRAYAVVVP